MSNPPPEHPAGIFDDAGWYDRTINWDARLARELPVLRDVFGSPGPRGLLDAGCGSGRHLAAMAEAGYRVTGLDSSADMLAVARAHLSERRVDARLIESTFEAIPTDAGPFDGVYCLGNALAATGEPGAAEESFAAMAGRLTPGGRLFIQLLNFARLRREQPGVRGPRVSRSDGVDYVSTRIFFFRDDLADVANVTHYQANGWQHFVRCGTLYAGATPDRLARWCEACNLRVIGLFGSYNREPFDPDRSNDLILLAERSG
ncbi:MAG: class I SAM-dependent methyltransferase [Phycisphaerae bacterium]